MEGFDWDEANKDKNWIKHKVSVKESEQVFFDKKSVLFEDVKHSQTEKRLVIIGKTVKRRFLHISFTLRFGKIRVISARDTDKKERNYYEKNK